jgi:hypothetical protein
MIAVAGRLTRHRRTFRQTALGIAIDSQKGLKRGHANVMWSQQPRGRVLAGAVSKTFP